jgi:hypothetical protein
MAKAKADRPSVSTFADHEIIVSANKLTKALSKTAHPDDDPVGRAEAALSRLSGEFSGWMLAECERLDSARHAVRAQGLGAAPREELFHAAHDVKGDALTFGYPLAAPAAESLCRVIEHTPDPERIPIELIDQHVDAVRAIVREYARPDIEEVATALNRKLSLVSYDFLLQANRSRPGYLQSAFAAPVSPGEEF